jgi:hypothetical protein
MATIQASFANVAEFFNSLLGLEVATMVPAPSNFVGPRQCCNDAN